MDRFDGYRRIILPASILAMLLHLPVASMVCAASPQQQWDELVAAAKKEGRLVLFASTEAEPRLRIPAAFRDRFGIVVEYLGGRGGEIATRIQSEQRAGQYYFDVAIAGTNLETLLQAGMLDPIRPALIHPDATDTQKWKFGKLFFLDPQQRYLLRISLYASILRAINTDHVKPEEASWQGLLNPKWKGKIATLDPVAHGAGQGHATYILHHLGEDYFTKLYSGQGMVFTRGNRELADWLARGTYPITIGVPAGELQRLKRDGLQAMVLENTKEVPGYTTAGRGYVGLVSRAPHPNAAKLFLNWLITKEGHEIYNRAAGVAGMRSDLDYSWAVKESIVQSDLDYLDSDKAEFRENIEPKLIKRMKELLSR